MSPNMTGALLMMATMAAFTVNDAFIKATGGAVPLFQLLFLRGVLTTGMILLLAKALGSVHFRIVRQDWGLIALRSASEIAAAYFFLTALFSLPLANVTAILQVLPLTVTLGSALVFKERVGWRRMSAIAVGFVGMLLIVRPGPDGFSIHAIYGLLAVLCVTVRDLSTRGLSGDVPSMTVTLSSSVAVMVFSGAASLADPWAPLTFDVVCLIVGASVCVLGGYYFSVRVMRVGEVSFTAPFRYSSLVWALCLGWLLFGEWPDSLTLLGAGIVVATGVFTLYRAGVAQRSAAGKH